MRTTRLIEDQRGIALPVALAVLFATALLATVAVRGGIVASHTSFRDTNAKRAIQAALSGIQAVRQQANLMQPDSASCTVKSGGQLTNVAATAGWCPAQTETLGDGASYTVQVSAATDLPAANGQSLVQRTVVSTGLVNGVQRRATIAITAARSIPPLPTNYAIVTGKKIDFAGKANITGGLGSNGDINLHDDSTVCGPITPGVGKKLKADKNLNTCGYTPAAATTPFALPPVDLSGPIASNDNIRITNAVNGSGTPTDTCSRCDKINWNWKKRTLTLDKDAVLTLSGNVYLICRLEVRSGATLQIGARTTPLWLYLDSMDNKRCGNKGSTAIINGKIVNLNSSAATFIMQAAGKPSHPRHIHGKINIGKDAITASAAPMAIYGPRAKVEFKDNANYKGTIVVGEVKAGHDVNITYDTGLANVPASGPRMYNGSRGSYKECTDVATVATTPTSGC